MVCNDRVRPRLVVICHGLDQRKVLLDMCGTVDHRILMGQQNKIDTFIKL